MFESGKVHGRVYYRSRPIEIHSGVREISDTSFAVPTVSLHAHERIDPRTIIEATRRRNSNAGTRQMKVFDQPEQNPPLREAITYNTNAERGSAQFLLADLMELPLINRYGNVNEVAAVFGDKHKPVEAVQRLRPLAHAA